MDTGRFPVDSQVDMTTWREVRVRSFCLLGLIHLCQNTTIPNYIAEEIFGHRCLFHFHSHGWKSGCLSDRVTSSEL